MRRHDLPRREFLRRSGLLGAGLVVPTALPPWLARPAASAVGRVREDDPWRRTEAILARIVPPSFPARDVDVTRFGAIGDGRADCTAAFREAIAACTSAGGGRVVVPPGRFLTGAIHLRSGVNLHVAEGATVAFSTRAADYLPAVLTRWQGVELMNYSPLIYALDAENIAVTGAGTLDGQANDDNWWSWKGSTSGAWGKDRHDIPRLYDMAERDVPVVDRAFGHGHHLRPSFLQPYRCRNVLIEGVTLLNAPMWAIHPVHCRNVTVRGVTVRSHGPNNDGCDPESCRDVLIERCTFETGDDCLALKSGRNREGRRLDVPVEDVIVRDCDLREGQGGVVVGSEMSGGARNIFIERCRMHGQRLNSALRVKANSVRGGFVEQVYLRDVTVGQVTGAVVMIDLFYEEGDTGDFPPRVGGVGIQRLTSARSAHAVHLRGYPYAPIRDVRLRDCRFDQVAARGAVEHVDGMQVEDVLVNGMPWGAWVGGGM